LELQTIKQRHAITDFKEKQRKINSRNPVTIDTTNLEINEKLAETGGSYASVFGCFVDGWQCAMKELDVHGVSDTAVKGLEREIELLEGLQYHPNIIRYLFHQKKGTKLRLYMTKYPASLGKIILERDKEVEQKTEPFIPVEITKWCIDIATGLEFLKSNNIIHRDLKSDNIFVMKDTHGEISRLIIGDFDTAKRINIDQNVLPKTIIGTPCYMAPEVINAQTAGSYSFQADVWSFGMVLFELLTLKPPYSDVPSFDVPGKIISGIRPTLLRDLTPEYEPLMVLFQKCTEMQPQERPDISLVKEELHTIQWLFECQ